MARSGDNLADVELQPGQYDDQANQTNDQPGPQVQPGTIPGSAESRQELWHRNCADSTPLLRGTSIPAVYSHHVHTCCHGLSSSLPKEVSKRLLLLAEMLPGYWLRWLAALTKTLKTNHPKKCMQISIKLVAYSLKRKISSNCTPKILLGIHIFATCLSNLLDNKGLQLTSVAMVQTFPTGSRPATSDTARRRAGNLVHSHTSHTRCHCSAATSGSAKPYAPVSRQPGYRAASQSQASTGTAPTQSSTISGTARCRSCC